MKREDQGNLVEPQPLWEVIRRVPAWQGAKEITVEPQPGGKTNANVRVTVDGERFVLRISGENTASLGIDRATEHAALLVAYGIGVAPEVTAYLMPEGHLVTRFIEGKEWTPEEFRQPEIVRRVAETMKRVHALPAIEGRFDPYRDIEERLVAARARNIPMPEHLGRFLERAAEIQASREAALGGRWSLCHNDPWHNNFLDDGTVRLLDWEFAGMGDPFFDLASIAGFSSPEERIFLLERYFGEPTPEALRALNDMLFVVMFWNATWALMQIGITYTTEDYAGMARGMFGFMGRQL